MGGKFWGKLERWSVGLMLVAVRWANGGGGGGGRGGAPE